jgi:hypothetical protein
MTSEITLPPLPKPSVFDHYNRWRRGQGKATQPSVEDIGIAIDVAVKVIAAHKVAMETLRNIAMRKRRTQEQRLAYATVKFLDTLDKDAS